MFFDLCCSAMQYIGNIQSFCSAPLNNMLLPQYSFVKPISWDSDFLFMYFFILYERVIFVLVLWPPVFCLCFKEWIDSSWEKKPRVKYPGCLFGFGYVMCFGQGLEGGWFAVWVVVFCCVYLCSFCVSCESKGLIIYIIIKVIGCAIKAHKKWWSLLCYV